MSLAGLIVLAGGLTDSSATFALPDPPPWARSVEMYVTHTLSVRFAWEAWGEHATWESWARVVGGWDLGQIHDRASAQTQQQGVCHAPDGALDFSDGEVAFDRVSTGSGSMSLQPSYTLTTRARSWWTQTTTVSPPGWGQLAWLHETRWSAIVEYLWRP